MSFISCCPRCGSRTLETLQTYSHCSECLYFVDFWRDTNHKQIRSVREAETALIKLKPENRSNSAAKSTVDSEGQPNEAA